MIYEYIDPLGGLRQTHAFSQLPAGIFYTAIEEEGDEVLVEYLPGRYASKGSLKRCPPRVKD